MREKCVGKSANSPSSLHATWYYLCPFLAALSRGVCPSSSRSLTPCIPLANSSTCLDEDDSAARWRGVFWFSSRYDRYFCLDKTSSKICQIKKIIYKRWPHATGRLVSKSIIKKNSCHKVWLLVCHKVWHEELTISNRGISYRNPARGRHGNKK